MKKKSRMSEAEKEALRKALDGLSVGQSIVVDPLQDLTKQDLTPTPLRDEAEQADERKNDEIEEIESGFPKLRQNQQIVTADVVRRMPLVAGPEAAAAIIDLLNDKHFSERKRP